jgi:hypothetical protein
MASILIAKIPSSTLAFQFEAPDTGIFNLCLGSGVSGRI